MQYNDLSDSTPGVFTSNKDKNMEWNRGAYQGPTYCGGYRKPKKAFGGNEFGEGLQSGRV